MKTLILGLGNPILSDDSVGLRVAGQLKDRVSIPSVSIAETSLAGLELMTMLSGYDKVILIDAIQTKGGKVGKVYRLDSNAFEGARHVATTHELGFATALQLGKKLGMVLPERICVIAIEVLDITTFSEECTEKVRQAIPVAVEKVLEELQQDYNSYFSGIV